MGSEPRTVTPDDEAVEYVVRESTEATRPRIDVGIHAVTVVVHELAHLEEPNHTDEFWALVAEYDPDYREHADWPDEHGVELVFSGADLRRSGYALRSDSLERHQLVSPDAPGDGRLRRFPRRVS